MNYLDIYHRALKDYRRTTVPDKECDKQRSATAKANDKQDQITLVQKICHVEIDWIEAIETGLEHVEKAIREDRQFIRSNGEVVDIEKVRSVSKDSVKHLAVHSDLITRYKEGEDIIPDRLYIVERLNDYAVYENRFLYMMLCYLRDFITLRYNEIVEIEHTYDGAMEMHKNIRMAKRGIDIDIALREIKKNDPYLAERSTSKKIIARIRDNLEMVHAFLNTPLMQEVSKVPMIKPPVTRTNVLRMNRNFRGALALYEFVSAYDKPGYVVEEKIHKIQPFQLNMADEFAEVVLLSSFLTYKHALSVETNLQQMYEIEEQRRREEESRRHLEQLKDLRRRINDSGDSPEEYMLMLERRNRALETDHEALVAARAEIEKMREKIDTLNKQNEEHLITIENLKDYIERMKIAHEEEIRALVAEYEAKIKALHEEYQAKIRALHEKYQAEIRALHEKYQAEIQALHENYQAQIERLHADYQAQLQAQKAEYEARIETLRGEYEEKIAVMREDYETQLTTMRDEYEGQLTSIRDEYEEKLTTQRDTYESQIEELHTDYRSQIDDLTTNYQTEIDGLHATYGERIETLERTAEEDMARTTEQYESQISDLTTTMHADEARYRTETQNMTSAHQIALQASAEQHKQETAHLHVSLDDLTAKLEATKRECEALRDARRLAEARLQAMRLESGATGDVTDYTTKEAFTELEHQYRVFKSMFGKEWKRAKKSIRKNAMDSYRDAVKSGTDQEFLRQMTEEHINKPDGENDNEHEGD